MWILAIILMVPAAVVIFFMLPFSKTKSDFKELTDRKISAAAEINDVFSEDDIKDLPVPVQKYFRYCGYLGTKKMSYMKAEFKDVDFIMSEDRTVKIDYTQYNFVEKPERFALISSSLFGIPFEGLDSYDNGTGSMKGTVAKVITLFDYRGAKMDKASLVTILAECLLAPNIALQDYIVWEPIDDTHAKAVITYYGITASGVFTFDDNGAMLSFRTSDRTATDMNGNEREVEWSAFILDYHDVNGIKLPKTLQSVWHYPEGDSIYFNENKVPVNIEYK